VSYRDNFEAATDGNSAIRRAAIYTRYSSRMQRPTSTADQIFQCREAAEKRGWSVADEHIRSDEERSGQTLIGRDGVAELAAMAAMKPRPFDVIIIDDSSRLGRDQADTLTLWKRLKFHGVSLYIVSYQLCSTHPFFSDMFSFMTRRDEEASTQHGWRVIRGKKGRFREGFHPGGRCYGYINEPIEDKSRKGVHGRYEVIGCKQRINPEEAAIVRSIFNDYISGQSLSKIAKGLNARGVKPPQGARKRCQDSWSKEAVYSIMENQRYIGRAYWNRTYQVRNPDTGKKESRLRPEQEVMWSFNEELRIVSNETFQKAVEQRKRMYRDNRVQVLGGMSRTDAARQYLLSGLLRCGVCRTNMTITGGNPVYYGCKLYRQRGTCSNSVTIRRDVLEQALRDGLNSRLSEPELRPTIIAAVYEQLLKQQKEAETCRGSLAEQADTLRAERRKLEKAVGHLTDAIAEMGGSPSIRQKIVEAEGRIEQIDSLLVQAASTAASPVDLEEVRKFVETKIGGIGDMLLADPVTAKNEIRKYITDLVLTPFGEGKERGYVITGDVELFGVEKSRVMQEVSMERKPLHYTIPIHLRIQASRNHNRRVVEEGSLPRCA
jgi:site-specific DNA recombinase